MNTQHLVLAILWILYCVLHSGLASLQWKAQVKIWMGNNFRYYRLVYTLFAFASLAGVIAYQLQIDSSALFATTLFTQIVGSLVFILGLIIMAICIRKYFMHLSGLKSLYLNDEQAANQLQVSGIHRFVRHPLYLGTFMTIWGLWLLFPQLSLLIANVIITLYTVWAIGLEEKKLVAEFGDAYRRYQKQVPKLVPLPGRTAPESF